MGFAGTSLVVATHIEIAFTHTGGMPVGIHQFCLSSRRATARLHPDGRVEFRERPRMVHRLLPPRGHRVSAAIAAARTTCAMDRVRADHARDATRTWRALKLGDVVVSRRRRLHGARGRLPQGRRRRARRCRPRCARSPTSTSTARPAASVRPDGTYAVEAVTATASFRFGKSMTRWFERSGAKVIVGKAGLTELAYREWFVPHGACLSHHRRLRHGRRLRPAASSACARCTGSASSGIAAGAVGAARSSASGRSWSRATARAGACSRSPIARLIERLGEVYAGLPPT